MSTLSASFHRRQPLQRNESSSTIASSEVEVAVNQQKATELVTSNALDTSNRCNLNGMGQNFLHITSSSDIKVGERITNIYNSYYSRG